MKILVIHNSVAGKKRKVVRTARRILQNFDYDWVETNKNGDYLEKIDGKIYNRVVVFGGDGTVHQTVNWILKNNYDLVLGVVPVGSANLLAKSFKIPSNVGLALDLALTGETETIDVGLINKEKYFIIAAGLGYDAWVIKNTKRAWKRLFGFFAYTISAWHGLFHLRETNFSFTIDGQRVQHHAKTVFIMNFGKFLGFGLGPDFSYNDGCFSLAVVRTVKPIDYVRMLGRLIGRKFNWEKRLDYYKFKRLQINYDKNILLQVDGEGWQAGSPIEIEVAKQKLKVVTR